jgi:hypothetical protein
MTIFVQKNGQLFWSPRWIAKVTPLSLWQNAPRQPGNDDWMRICWIRMLWKAIAFRRRKPVSLPDSNCWGRQPPLLRRQRNQFSIGAFRSAKAQQISRHFLDR